LPRESGTGAFRLPAWMACSTPRMTGSCLRAAEPATGSPGSTWAASPRPRQRKSSLRRTSIPRSRRLEAIQFADISHIGSPAFDVAPYDAFVIGVLLTPEYLFRGAGDGIEEDS